MYEERNKIILGEEPDHNSHLKCLFGDNINRELLLHIADYVINNGQLAAANENMQVDGEDCTVFALYSPEDYIILQLTGQSIKEQNNILSIFPSSRGGRITEITITNIQEYGNGYEAIITGEIMNGKKNISFFDTNYFEHKDEIKIGDKREFLIVAYAYEAGILTEEQRIVKMNPDVMKAMAENLGKDMESMYPEIDISTGVAFEQHYDDCLDDGEFQSPVLTDVKEVTVAGESLYNIPMTLWQDLDDETIAFDISLYARTSFFESKPSIGDPLYGTLWLIGRTKS